MYFMTRSGSRYETTSDPDHGLVLVGDGISETFDLKIIRADDDPWAPSGEYSRCAWLTPVELGRNVEILVLGDNGHITLSTTKVVEIGMN